ncbi:MAG: hypothetical protein R6U96_16475 [Promethearchaeia archaeon]
MSATVGEQIVVEKQKIYLWACMLAVWLQMPLLIGKEWRCFSEEYFYQERRLQI